ncbi:hypothetical protein ACFVFJ_00015 [Streptomyces sp. NPDC057717]|uniref:hypothetical protein n=1 Tax=unclassified Streptomyces TaxID=2593676 RepID=UPI0036CF3362
MPEAIRSLRVVHRSAVKSLTQTINQIRTLIVSAPANVRERLLGLPTHPVDAQLPALAPAQTSPSRPAQFEPCCDV